MLHHGGYLIIIINILQMRPDDYRDQKDEHGKDAN